MISDTLEPRGLTLYVLRALRLLPSQDNLLVPEPGCSRTRYAAAMMSSPRAGPARAFPKERKAREVSSGMAHQRRARSGTFASREGLHRQVRRGLRTLVPLVGHADRWTWQSLRVGPFAQSGVDPSEQRDGMCSSCRSDGPQACEAKSSQSWSKSVS